MEKEHRNTTSNEVTTPIDYIGNWQFEDRVRQELAGPIGQGKAIYPNGDVFEGFFHLSYAHINGPAYAAKGRYTFADGSYIEKAWIHTDEKLQAEPKNWGLHGIFRIHHPQGPDSIAMFISGLRYGFELFLDEQKPWVKEWYAGKSIAHHQESDEPSQYAVADFDLDETSRVNCITLHLTLKDGDDVYRIKQQGGDYEANYYGNYIYKLTTRANVCLPNGDSIVHYGDDLRDFKPYNGYITYHKAATQQYRKERWKDGLLVEAEEWQYDTRK